MKRTTFEITLVGKLRVFDPKTGGCESRQKTFSQIISKRNPKTVDAVLIDLEEDLKQWQAETVAHFNKDKA